MDNYPLYTTWAFATGSMLPMIIFNSHLAHSLGDVQMAFPMLLIVLLVIVVSVVTTQLAVIQSPRT